MVARNTSVIDNMVSMMEKYSTQLEEQVADRSCELAEEKHKTELLLLKMLPKSAQLLNTQNKVVITGV